MSEQKYKDGEYEVTGFYSGGKKNIIVKVRLASDKISSVEVIPTATIKMSLGLQKKFAIAIPEVVIGRPIDEVYLDKLAGSSLTTKGFNNALDQIKATAINK